MYFTTISVQLYHHIRYHACPGVKCILGGIRWLFHFLPLVFLTLYSIFHLLDWMAVLSYCTLVGFLCLIIPCRAITLLYSVVVQLTTLSPPCIICSLFQTHTQFWSFPFLIQSFNTVFHISNSLCYTMLKKAVNGIFSHSSSEALGMSKSVNQFCLNWNMSLWGFGGERGTLSVILKETQISSYTLNDPKWYITQYANQL